MLSVVGWEWDFWTITGILPLAMLKKNPDRSGAFQCLEWWFPEYSTRISSPFWKATSSECMLTSFGTFANFQHNLENLKYYWGVSLAHVRKPKRDAFHFGWFHSTQPYHFGDKIPHPGSEIVDLPQQCSMRQGFQFLLAGRFCLGNSWKFLTNGFTQRYGVKRKVFPAGKHCYLGNLCHISGRKTRTTNQWNRSLEHPDLMTLGILALLLENGMFQRGWKKQTALRITGQRGVWMCFSKGFEISKAPVLRSHDS